MGSAEELPEVLWIAGQRGLSQTCDAICLAASLESGSNTDECVSEWLEAYWLDTTCIHATTARADAGQAPWTNCPTCGPNDFTNAYCLPGIIDSVSGEAFHGVSVAPSMQPTCNVQYTDARVLPLCPCAVVPPAEALGWTITILILVGFSLYTVLGVVYGRYSKATTLEKQENGVLSTIMTASSDSHSVIIPSSHPHFELWGELPGLVTDGYKFFMVAVGLREKSQDTYTSLDDDELERKYNEDLAARRGGGPAAAGASSGEQALIQAGGSGVSPKKKRKKKEKKKERRGSEGGSPPSSSSKSKTRKPRPSLPAMGSDKAGLE